jgi:hypothetical protein
VSGVAVFLDEWRIDGVGGVFDKKLDVLNGSNSESQLCIEEFLIKSEQEWFDSEERINLL